jgi:hypothetical protein
MRTAKTLTASPGLVVDLDIVILGPVVPDQQQRSSSAPPSIATSARNHHQRPNGHVLTNSGTSSHQRSTLPTTRAGHDLSVGLNLVLALRVRPHPAATGRSLPRTPTGEPHQALFVHQPSTQPPQPEERPDDAGHHWEGQGGRILEVAAPPRAGVSGPPAPARSRRCRGPAVGPPGTTQVVSIAKAPSGAGSTRGGSLRPQLRAWRRCGAGWRSRSRRDGRTWW